MGFELDFLHALQALHNPVLDRLMLFITRLGDGNFIWFLISIVMIIIPSMKKVFNKKCDNECKDKLNERRNVGFTIIIALFLSVILVNLCMKNIFNRLRPFQVDTSIISIIMPSDSSFPSGHTSSAFAAAVSIFLTNKKAGIMALILAVLIAFSRMYFFVHFPTDILGGILAGAICAKIATVFVKKLH